MNLLNKLKINPEPQKPKETVVVIKDGNYSGAIQEYCAKNGLPAPQYIFEKEGPAHNPTFVCISAVNINGRDISFIGRGHSKTDARQVASKLVFDRLMS